MSSSSDFSSISAAAESHAGRFACDKFAMKMLHCSRSCDVPNAQRLENVRLINRPILIIIIIIIMFCLFLASTF